MVISGLLSRNLRGRYVVGEVSPAAEDRRTRAPRGPPSIFVIGGGVDGSQELPGTFSSSP